MLQIGDCQPWTGREKEVAANDSHRVVRGGKKRLCREWLLRQGGNEISDIRNLPDLGVRPPPPRHALQVGAVSGESRFSRSLDDQEHGLGMGMAWDGTAFAVVHPQHSILYGVRTARSGICPSRLSLRRDRSALRMCRRPVVCVLLEVRLQAQPACCHTPARHGLESESDRGDFRGQQPEPWGSAGSGRRETGNRREQTGGVLVCAWPCGGVFSVPAFSGGGAQRGPIRAKFRSDPGTNLDRAQHFGHWTYAIGHWALGTEDSIHRRGERENGRDHDAAQAAPGRRDAIFSSQPTGNVSDSR